MTKPTPQDMTQLEEILKLMDKYNVNKLSINSISIEKSKPSPTQSETKPNPETIEPQSDLDILFNMTRNK